MPRRSVGTPEPEAGVVIDRARRTFGDRLLVLLGPGSVEAAATYLGVDRSTIFRWRKSDRREPGLYRVAALAEYLSVSMDEIVGAKTPTRQLTVYETDRDIRKLVDGLAALPPAVRQDLIERMLWHVAQAATIEALRIKTSPEKVRDGEPEGGIVRRPLSPTPDQARKTSSEIDPSTVIEAGTGVVIPGTEKVSASAHNTERHERKREGRRGKGR